jgi:hypothetical protein
MLGEFYPYMDTSHKTLALVFALVVTGCVNSSGGQTAVNSSSSSSHFSSEETGSMRLSAGCLGQKGPNSSSPWIQLFEKTFPAIVSSKDFKQLWSVETECLIDGTNTLVTYVYLANKHEYLHTVVAVFNPEKQLLKHVDIACPFYDDIGGATLMTESQNQVLVRCYTLGTEGEYRQYYSLNLDTFLPRLVVEKKCTYHVDLRFDDPNVPEKLIQTAFDEVGC